MDLEILTPEKTIYKGDASLVQLPGIDGLFEILNNHAPLISVLSEGKVKIKVGDEFKYFDINGGVVEVMNNKTLVLAE